MKAFFRRAVVVTMAAAAGLAAPIPRARADDLVVFAAASLKESLEEVVQKFSESGHEKPVLSFGASSALARQIENGAPASLFLSADEQWMDDLAAHHFVASGTSTDLLGNVLVLVAFAAKPFSIEIQPGFALEAVLGSDKLALADPESVPAGRYAKAALESLGVWKNVEPNVVREPDVRSAMAMVERGEARAGIVYRTDAKISDRVVVVGTFPESSHAPIVYPMAIVAGHDDARTRELRDFLMSKAAAEIFRSHGFTVF
ncbi:MAG TPA: molybdate ABC transporter substrate-binding protein [Candidatus Binatia bacterium]|jgi:molybdate transport system substrate-binding protein